MGSAEYIDGNYGESYPKDSEFVESGIPFFTSAVTGSQGIWNYKYVKYITKEKNDTLLKAQSKGGDLVLTNRGASMGVICQIPLHYKDVNIGPQLTRIRGKENILDNLFLLSNLKTKKCYEQLLASNAGSAMPFISLTNLSNLNINVPNYAEQIKLGKIFYEIDNLITLHQRKSYIKIYSWEQRKLGDCFTERVESMPDGELISVTINDGIKKFSELGRHDNSNEDKSKYKKVCVGDIAYNSMRMWQGASGYSPYEGIVSPAYTVLSPNSGINSKCLAYQFKLPDMIHTFQINSQGITSDNWNLKYPALSEIEVFISKDEQEQAKIAEYFENLDRLITLHQH